MPRLFLHIHNSSGVAADEEGHEVADLPAAEAIAIAGIRSMLCDEIQHGVFDLRGRIEIADEAGALVRVVPFREAIELRLDEEAA